MKFLNLLFLFILLSSCSKESITKIEPDIDDGMSDVKLDTIELRVFLAVDKPTIDFYGNKESYLRILDSSFSKINKKWNGEPDNPNFKYYFRYIPCLEYIYTTSSIDAERKVLSEFNPDKHDVVMLVDGVFDHDDEIGNFNCGGSAPSIIKLTNDKKTTPLCKDFIKNDWEAITHELGHYRGVTDLYADNVSADKNPVNGKAYNAEDCVMNYCYGIDTWSDYAKNIINYTAKSKMPGVDFPNLFYEMFPEKMKIKVSSNGKPISGIQVNMYGTRGSYNDVVVPAYRTFNTDSNGECLVEKVPELYTNPPQPNRPADLPWGRWFGFILEVEYNGEKKYEWIPEYKIQNITFEGKEIYEVNFEYE